MKSRNQMKNVIKILMMALFASGLLAIAKDVVTALAAVSWN